MAASNAASASVSSAAPRLLLLRRRGGASASAQHRNARFRPAAAAAATSAGGGSGGGSYLDMWRKAVERERRSAELARRLQEAPPPAAEADAPPAPPVPVEDVRRRTARFEEMLRVPREERDRVQRRQVIDRAAAALAAARAVLKEPPPASPPSSPPPTPPQVAETARVGSAAGGAAGGSDRSSRPAARAQLSPSAEVQYSGGSSPSKQSSSKLGTPGPDFWSWLPPVQDSSKQKESSTGLKPSKKMDTFSSQPDLLMEKERSADSLSLPFETAFFKKKEDRSLPPFQSFAEPDNVDSKADLAADKKDTFEEQFSKNPAEVARALSESAEKSSHGIHLDGSMWWKETGVEQRPDGVACKWTIMRGVSADGAVEWEDKYWEASDRFDHKELGSEKSGRDAAGNVWREYWKESMWQDYTCGVMHMEKTADKWGQNGRGEQWQEQWFEHYDSTGKTEKWADKWCSLDPNTPLDVGHAHVWHERWGEKYDGFGGSTKYTDKWAERSEGDGWSKWGDKWDEHFDPNGHGIKQGETWWAGKYGDRWNRTWGEQHNGSGWVHKYGRSSSGEHWDTHVPQDTWYERFPHFGFYHCFENSVQLRSVKRQPPPRK
ncbi:protein LIKE EARLY STARVATION, chloroplastic-like [Miscanthus floridulus]|uniref:protein LIKE EARLY STARVATION, chloroplastic-like n=1 Tax=Miscanthus floridulus TaxID=154761 RepID=UPI00345B23AE